MNRDWVDFLSVNRRYTLSIGFEIFRHLQNSLRVGYGAFADSYSIVSNNLRILKEAGIPFGILTVIEPETLKIPPREWLQAVVEHGISQVGLQFSYHQIYTGNMTKVQAYIDWIDLLFLEQAKHNESCSPDCRLKIRESYYLYNMLRETNVSYSCCHHSPAICSDFLVSVGEDGRVYGHCDAFMGTRGENGEHYLLGSILDQNFESIMVSFKLKKIRHELSRGREKCRACAYFELCRGGCGFFKSMTGGSIAAGFGDSIESYCAMKIALLSYVAQPKLAETIVRAYSYLNKRYRLPGTLIQTEDLSGECAIVGVTPMTDDGISL